MKRFLSMVLAVALVLTTFAIPVMAEDATTEETPSYAVKGIYEGAVIVFQHESSRKITVVDYDKKSVVSDVASNVAKVEFYQNSELAATDSEAPYEYNLASDKYGANTLQVKVYDVNDKVHTFSYNYTLAKGSKHYESMEDNFDSYDAATVTKDELVAEFFNGISNDIDVSIETVNGSQALKIATPETATGWHYAALKPSNKNRGLKVHYFEFDFANSASYASNVFTREYFQSAAQTTLFATNKNIYTGQNSGSSFNGLNVKRKLGVILDYNPATPIATVYIDGYQWFTKEMVGLTKPQNQLQFGLNGASKAVVLDNFKYTVYEEVTTNELPVVSVKAPTQGIAGTTSTLKAQASDADGAVDYVEFYADGALIEGSRTDATVDGFYTFDWTVANPTNAASVAITAKAYDSNGEATESAAATMTIVDEITLNYAVKGMYEGATIVAQQEATRKITVVDEANANLVSDVATDVEKVEFIHNGELVATDSEAPYEYALGFKKYFNNTLEIKVYDAYDRVNTFGYNYYVANGVENSASFEENFDDPKKDYSTHASLAALFAGNDGANVGGRLTLSVEADANGNNSLKVDGDGANKSAYLQFRSAPSTTGAKVHYYEFDMKMSTSMSRNLSVTADGYQSLTNSHMLFNNKNTAAGIGTNSSITSTKIAKIGLVLDYSCATPTAIVYKDGELWKTIPMTNLANGAQDPVVTLYVQTHSSGHPVYIDNFKYDVYDLAPEKFGLLENSTYEEFVQIKGDNSKRNVDWFKVGATNLTTAPVTVRNVIAAYDPEGRLRHIYEEDRYTVGTTPGAVYATSATLTFEAGEVNKEYTYKFNMGDDQATYLKCFTFYALTGDDAFVPVEKYAE